MSLVLVQPKKARYCPDIHDLKFVDWGVKHKKTIEHERVLNLIFV